MVQSLKDWALKKTIKISAWGAAVNLLRYGSKLWQAGGRRDIYTNVKNESIIPLIADLRKEERERVLKSLINPVKI